MYSIKVFLSNHIMDTVLTGFPYGDGDGSPEETAAVKVRDCLIEAWDNAAEQIGLGRNHQPRTYKNCEVEVEYDDAFLDYLDQVPYCTPYDRNAFYEAAGREDKGRNGSNHEMAD